ncbi:MAG: 23S rRNA (adenine(1618)-N(6))-methyltransferase RlmF [Saprospiraceae bacterium]|nr:23S rRNA (adenine(1618)-N(6))-methyltransferase RlmF [Saprospiraceae bacterium]
MHAEKKKNDKSSSRLHVRNIHQGRYDLGELIKECPDLEPFVIINKYGNETIDFFNPEAVKWLNTALLKNHYQIKFWEIPEGYLCPPIPGRVDYIHHIADLLGKSNNKIIPRGLQISCLDIGVGANGVYPIIGHAEYGWTFVGSDIDEVAVASVKNIISNNPHLINKINIRHQNNPRDIFSGVIKTGEFFDVTICNPPFHKSESDALASNARKVSNLRGKKVEDPIRNFGGRSSELWCDGGEEQFVRNMINESKRFSKSCFWFTTLISKQNHLKGAYKQLRKAKAFKVETLPMGQGNKSSRILAWTFHNKTEQRTWISKRWSDVGEEE